MIFSISKDSIEKIINKKGNNRHSLASEMKILPNTYRKKKRNSSNIAKVKSLMLKENLPTQRYIVNTLKCPVSSVNKIINSDLKLKKAKKYNVHRLSQRVSIIVKHAIEYSMKNIYQKKNGKIS